MATTKRPLNETELEGFLFLNSLRASAICNMFEGPSYMAKQLGYTRAESIRIWELWTQHFNEAGEYKGVMIEID